MKEKKKSPNWYIAATHYLTAGFAIPFIIGLVASLLLETGLSSLLLPNLLLSRLYLWIVRILSIWLGIMYSANYLKKTYIIEDKNKIINLAMIYFVVLNSGWILVTLTATKEMSVYFSLESAIAALLFYVFSRKYVKNTEVESQTQQNVNT